MTGRPSIASKMPMKSCFWNGSSSARAALRPASSSARIIFRMATIRWSPKNMCSVRHRPIPSAPNDRALAESSGVSALVRILRVRTLSAHDMNVAKSPVICGSTVGTLPIITSPVVPSIVRKSPALTVWPPIVIGPGLLVDPHGLATDDARLAPAACDDRRVAGLAAGGGENALRQVHAGHVFRAGLLANQQDRIIGVLRRDARWPPRPKARPCRKPRPDWPRSPAPPPFASPSGSSWGSSR